jgi:hypothetical protein
MTTKEGTFVVVACDANSAIVHDVGDSEPYPLVENPDLERGWVLEATLVAEPPMELEWNAEIEAVREVDLVPSDLEPSAQAREAAAGLEPGDSTRIEGGGSGEVHVVSIGDEGVEQAMGDVFFDTATLERAGRLGAGRVEVRAGEGILSVGYLPD